MGNTNFTDFISSAWNDHADQAEAVAQRLESSHSQIKTGADAAALARIVGHVFGEHLAAYERGKALLARARASLASVSSESSSDNASTRRAIDRADALLSFLADDAEVLNSLAEDDQIAVLATASSAYVERGDASLAIALYDSAILRAANGIEDGSPALRALAVGGNNLAQALESRNARTTEETEGMVRAAKGGLIYWRRAGTWLEEERAAYRLAKSLIVAERYSEAIEAAELALNVCAANDAPAFECFFNHAADAIAQQNAGNQAAFFAARAQALACYEMIAVDERVWCESELKTLESLTPLS